MRGKQWTATSSRALLASKSTFVYRWTRSRATCARADEHGIPVTAHLELVNASDAIRAGMDGIEHITSFGTDLAEPEVAKSFRQDVGDENEARHAGRYRLWATLDLQNSPRTKRLLDLIVEHNVFVSPTLATSSNVAQAAGMWDAAQVAGFENMMRFVGMCQQAGATVVTGSAYLVAACQAWLGIPA